MPLRADLTRQLQGVHYLLLPLLDLLHGGPSLQPHLQVKADDLENLIVRRREARMLLVPRQLRLTLNDDLNFFFFAHDWIAHKIDHNQIKQRCHSVPRHLFLS